MRDHILTGIFYLHMGSGGNKKAEQYDARANAAITDVKATNPFQARLDAQVQKWFDWEDGVDKQPRDITAAPGIGDYLDIYGNAQKLASQERMGSGAIRLSDSNSAYGDQVKKQQADEIYDMRASGLSGALGDLKNRAYGIAGASIDSDSERKRTIAELELRNRSDYYNRPKQPSIWSQLLAAGAQVAGSAAQAGAFGGV